MSALIDQIKAKFATVAENLKRIYEKGFSDGKASVRHITFYIISDYEETFCALSGMTWREWVNSDLNTDNYYHIEENNNVYRGAYPISDASADDKIVEYGVYYELSTPMTIRYADDVIDLYRGYYWTLTQFIESDQNTIGLYFDDEGFVRDPLGNYLHIAESGDEGWYVYSDYTNLNRDTGDEFTWYSDFILERKADCYFQMGDDWNSTGCVCTSGMTWNEFADSRFSDAITIDGEEIYHDYGAWNVIYLNGVKVKPNDVIVQGGFYYTSYEE